jgi:hypothetical protein
MNFCVVFIIISSVYTRISIRVQHRIVAGTLGLAQAVSRWLPTVAVWVRVRAEHVGFVVDKAALGQVFPASHATNFSIIIIIRGGHNWWPQCRVDPNWPPPPNVLI